MKLTFEALDHIIFAISFITTIISVLAVLFLTFAEDQTTLAAQIIFYEILFLSLMLGLDIYVSKAIKEQKKENEEVIK